LVDIAAAIDTIELTGVVQYHAKPRGNLGALAFWFVAMYEAVARKYPALAKYFRVHEVAAPEDLLQR